VAARSASSSAAGAARGLLDARVVDDAVAVVVEAVADLGRGEDLALAIGVVPADAGAHPAPAYAGVELEGIAVEAVDDHALLAGAALVDDAVAVVVDAVADLLARRRGLARHLPATDAERRLGAADA